jgi:hypothetical protein
MNRWNSDAFSDQQLSQVISKDLKERLEYRPHSLYGWRPLPDQRLHTIEINGNGLRSKKISESNSSKRCLILGGSFAWGFGSSSNNYIPSYLIEEILNKDYGIDISFINMAEQVYSSIEEIKSFVFSIDELKPSFILCISGYNDISQGYKGAFKANGLFSKGIEFFDWGKEMGLIGETSRVKRLAKVILRGHKQIQKVDDNSFLFDIPDSKDIPSCLYRHKTEVLNAFCLSKGIRVAYFLQPYIGFKQFLSSYEKEYIEFIGKQRCKYFDEQYKIIKREFFQRSQYYHADILNVDSTGFFEQCTDTIFFDSAHITDRGYKEYCDKLCQTLAPFYS